MKVIDISTIPYSKYVPVETLVSILNSPAVLPYLQSKLLDIANIDKQFGQTLIKILNYWTLESATKYITALNKFMPVIDKITPHYPEIFKLDTNKYSSLYRGTNLSTDKLKEFIQQTDLSKWTPVKLKNGLTFMVYWHKKFKYTPHRSMQSFSTNNDRAAEFGEAIVILDSTTSKFFMNPDYFYNISKQQDNEYETIHIGKNAKVWVGIEKAWFDDLIKNS